MTTFARIGREYVAQIAAFVVALSDRLFIPAVFLRMLGVASFSAWSIAIATGGFVSVLEFGVTRFFTNRLIELVERGEDEEAARVYRVGITFLIGLVVIALIVIAASFTFLVKGVGDPEIDRQLYWLAFPITLAAAAVQIIALRAALYRAHRAFEAETWIRLAGEAARIVCVVVAALSGLGLLAVCWTWLGATIAFVYLPMAWHTRRMFPRFADRVRKPYRDDTRSLARLAPGLWLQMMFTTLFATVPVFAIGALSASASAIAQFVLMRTIANFVRQILQMFSNVFGIELARRNARDDAAGFAQVFEETNRFLAAQTAVGCAVLVVLAQPLFGIWTGQIQLFDWRMLIFAILPPLVIPSAMLSIDALMYSNRPWPLVRARSLQAALTVVLMLILPIEHIGLRMMVALAIGEVGGLGLPLAVEVRRLNPLVGLRRGLVLLVRSLAAFALALAFVYPIWMFVPAPPLVRLALALAGGALAFAVVVPLVGMSAERRKSSITSMRDLLRRLGSQGI